MPHEGNVRAWPRRCRVSPEDIDDLIQESYCNLASLDAIERIDRPSAYFFSVARNLLLKRIRQASVVPRSARGPRRSSPPRRRTVGRSRIAWSTARSCGPPASGRCWSSG
jgi:DNA-directed RNA polymerase specialized sigma24 family protein